MSYCPFCSRRLSCNSAPECNLSYEPPLLNATTEVILDLRKQIKQCEHAKAQKAKGIYHWSNQPSGDQISAELASKYPCLGSGGHCCCNRSSRPNVCPFCGRVLSTSTSTCTRSASSTCAASSYQAPQYPVYRPPPPQEYQPPQYPVYHPPPPQEYQPPQYPVYIPPPPQVYQPPQYPVYVPPPPQLSPQQQQEQHELMLRAQQIRNNQIRINQQRAAQQARAQAPFQVQRPVPRAGGCGCGSDKIQQAIQHIDCASRILKSC